MQDTAWTDTGNVVVGNKGQGSLLITSAMRNAGAYGNPTINGDVQIGLRAGSGNVTVEGATLTVAGNTVLGAASLDAISIVGGEWNSAGHDVRLVGAPAGQSGGALSISQYGSLVAGMLVVGQGDTVESFGGGTLALGSSASGTAGSITGRLVLGQGSTLTAAGNLAVARSFDPGHEGGLQLEGGSATLSATGHFALSLVGQGQASVEYGSTLVATGGILAASEGALIVEQGTVTSQSSGLALNIAAGGLAYVQGGELRTTGELVIDNAHYKPGYSFGGTLMAGSGAVLDSDASAPGGLAVAIDGGSAEINAATWTVGGRFELGANGPGGILMEQNSQIAISDALHVGGQQSYGEVSTGNTDTVVVGGTLSAGQTGLSAASILIGGDGSSLSTGTLDVGTASARGSLAIDNGSVRVAGAATIDGVVRLGEGGLLSAQTITLDAKSVVLGMGTLSGSIVDQGAITVSHGVLSCLGPVTGGGILGVSGGTLQLGAAESASVVFGNAGTIVTPQVSDLAGTISGWQAGDAILFSNQAIASDSYANGTLSLFDSSRALLGTEMFKGALSAGDFMLSSAQGTASLLSYHG